MNRIIYFPLVFLFISISYTQKLDTLNNELLEIYTSGLAEGLNGELFIGVDLDNSDIYESTNSGMDWEKIGDAVIYDAEHIVVNSTGHIFAAGNSAHVIRSTDDGLSWNYLSVPYDIRSLAVADNDYLYIGVDDSPPIYLERSTDNGETWEYISEIVSGPVYAITTFGSDVFVGSGYNGQVYYSSNYGTSWVQTAVAGSTHITAISINDSGDVFAGNWAGEVYRSNDLGSSWNKIFDNGGCIASIITTVQDYLYVAVGRLMNNNAENIFRSSDDGLTWERIENGFTSNSINYMIHTKDNSLYITTRDQGVFKSTNFGDEWFNVGPVTSVNNDIKLLPDKYELIHNYPNPFNPSTTISYSVPEVEFVTLKVFDVLGNEVATLVNEELPAGSYEAEFNGTELTSGIYFYRIQSGSFVETKKMVLMK